MHANAQRFMWQILVDHADQSPAEESENQNVAVDFFASASRLDTTAAGCLRLSRGAGGLANQTEVAPATMHNDTDAKTTLNLMYMTRS